MKNKMKYAIILMMICLLYALPVEAKSTVKINKQNITLLKGKTQTLQIKGIKNARLNWKFNSKAIKIVSKKGSTVKIKAVKAGKTVVSTKVRGKTYKCNVLVVDPKLTKTKIELKKQQSTTLKIVGGAGKLAFKSNKPSVATVNSKGKIVAREAGNAVITVKQNGKTMTCKINVKLRSKKVWVKTKNATTVYEPIYEDTYYFECTTCKAHFNMETEDEEYGEHAENHLFSDEPAGWRDYVERKLLYVKETYYPEEGYWKTVYY